MAKIWNLSLLGVVLGFPGTDTSSGQKGSSTGCSAGSRVRSTKSSVNILWMTSASSMGTLVNSEVTSKLTRASSASTHTSFIMPTKCLKFKTCELVFPANGEITDAIYLESLYEGTPMHETMGLSGMYGLCILGSPYILGGMNRWA